MSARDTGGPAFPSDELHQGGQIYQQFHGMTLRDYFAAKALITAIGYGSENLETWEAKHFASHAYQIADAMLAERAKPEGAPPAKSLNASVADALRPFCAEGQKVIWREPFRWFDDQGVMSNHYDGANLPGLAEEFDYEIIVDMRDAGIIAKKVKL